MTSGLVTSKNDRYLINKNFNINNFKSDLIFNTNSSSNKKVFQENSFSYGLAETLFQKLSGKNLELEIQNEIKNLNIKNACIFIENCINKENLVEAMASIALVSKKKRNARGNKDNKENIVSNAINENNKGNIVSKEIKENENENLNLNKNENNKDININKNNILEKKESKEVTTTTTNNNNNNNKINYYKSEVITSIFPASNSLYISSEEYSKLLKIFWKKAFIENDEIAKTLFKTTFQYDQEMGGVSLGFYFKKLENNFKSEKIYYNKNIMPGFSSLSLITESGVGAVILINIDDPYFLYEVENILLEEYSSYYFVKNNLTNSTNKKNQNILINKQNNNNNNNIINQNLEKNKFLVNNINDYKYLIGSYRLLNSLPNNYKYLNFLNDVQIRLHENKIELSNVFENGIQVHLLPNNKKDLFLIKGFVEMGNWHLKINRDQSGNVVGFHTDLRVYKKISKFLSAQSLIIYMALICFSPLFFAIFYFTRRIPKAKSKS